MGEGRDGVVWESVCRDVAVCVLHVCVHLGSSMLATYTNNSNGEYRMTNKITLQKCCTQYASEFGKLSSGHRTGKGQFSFQSQRKGMPKNAQTTTQLHSSHTLGK